MEALVSNLFDGFIKDLLIDMITVKLEGIFTHVNNSVGAVAVEVGKTPQEWNSSIFNLIRSLSDTVIVPISSMIITFVLCYELIAMVMEKNNMQDFDTFQFFKYIFKMWVAVYIVTHAFDIAMAIFDLGQYVVSSSASAITGGSTDISITSGELDAMVTQLQNANIGYVFLLFLETLVMDIAMKILSITITITLYGRMIEIYLYCSISPIPFATMTNKEWGQMGNNYLRGLLALGFQGFFMLLCVGIYSILIQSLTITSDIEATILSIPLYSFILFFTLRKSSTISKSIFNAH